MVNPVAPDGLLRVRAALGAPGLRVVCLFPAMHRYSLSDPKVAEVVGTVAADAGRGAVRPLRRAVGRRPPQAGARSRFELRYGQPLDVQRFAVDYPSLPIIVPHFGAGFFREALMLAEACPNVVLDTSSTNGWVRYHPGLTLTDVFRTAMAVLGPDRLMFGTDSSFFPRGWQTPIYDTQRAILEQLGTEDGFRAAIFGGTFNRLFPA